MYAQVYVPVSQYNNKTNYAKENKYIRDMNKVFWASLDTFKLDYYIFAATHTLT